MHSGRVVRFGLIASLALVLGGAAARPALAGTKLAIGVNDDAVKWRPGAHRELALQVGTLFA
jgi:hypothetical protein